MEFCQTLFLIIAVFSQSTFQFSFPRKSLYGSLPKQSWDHGDANSGIYKYETKTIDVPVDHFSYAVQATFKLRYLVNNTWQGGQDAPIFFYTGNEGNIENFARNTGFMWDIAPQFEALIVFAEHRYYGVSMPFGNKSYSDPQHLGYLTSQQALADYIYLIEYFRSKPETKRSPVIVFGGSYGGMLSAWIRIKYPHIVQGAIASSAPVLQFTGVTACEAFSRIITSDFRAAHSSCPKFIRKSWSIIKNVTSNDAGKKWLSENWKLCKPLNSSADVTDLMSFLNDVYTNIAVVNYPYNTSFLTPLPSYPVKAMCKHLTNTSLTGKDLLTALHKGISVYTNYTGKASCIDITDATPELGAVGWPYQTCTEMVMPMCTDGVNDMFEPEAWNLEAYTQQCMKQYSVKPQANTVCQQYGCTDLSAATNIVFSNGLLDPWSSGGVLRNLSSSAIAILIPESAHHLDLRSNHSNDPYSVVLARKYHRFFIRKWIEEYREKEERLAPL